MSWSNLPGQECSLLCSFSSLSRRGSLLVCFVYLTLSIFPTKGRLQKIKETLGALEHLKGLHGLLPVMADLVVVEESFFRGPLLSHQLPAPKVHCKGPLQFTNSLPLFNLKGLSSGLLCLTQAGRISRESLDKGGQS